MGLADTASHFIWALTILAVVAGLADALQSNAQHVGDARDAQDELRTLRLTTRLSQTTWCHDAAQENVDVVVENVGERVLDASKVSFLIDGVPVTTFTHVVEGDATTTLWAPGETALFVIEGVATSPSIVGIVSPEGAFRAAVEITCRRLTTIVVTPDAVTLDPGATQTFTAQGYDQYGAAWDAAPFTWVSDAGTVTVLDGTSASLTVGTTPGTAFTMTASSGGVQGVATVAVRQLVHVDSMGTYNAGVADSTFLKRETVETRVVVRDHNNDLVQGAAVTIQIHDPSGILHHEGSAVTDVNGVASISYTLPSNAAFGTWTDAVVGISGTNMAHRSADDVVSQVTFTVSN